MYNKTLYTFIDHLVDSDFLILKRTDKGTNYVCNPYEIVKNIKELSSLVSGLNHSKDLKFVFYSENLNVVQYLRLSLKELGLDSKNIFVTTNSREITSGNSKAIVFILGNYNSNIVNHFLENSIYSIYFINKNNKSFISGSYNMFNDLSNLKKIIFFITILSKIINK